MPGPLDPPELELNANGRIVAIPPTTAPTNADETETTDNGGGDFGLDAPIRTQSTTQSITNPGGDYDGGFVAEVPEPAYDYGGDYDAGLTPPSVPLTNAGASPGDDAANNTRVQTEKDLNQNFNASEVIKPQPNILDRFASYTYTASVYLMTPQQYQKMLATKKKTVNGYNLLFQSGGAPNNTGGARGPAATAQGNQLFDTEAQTTAASANTPDAGRNPAFANDFYIDTISIDNALPGKNTGAAHMVTGIKFTVVEPNGITLLDRLYQAVQDHIPKDGAGKINYTAVTYLMVIRWYGYDENGNLQKVGAVSPDGLSDPNAITEKFIPFLIKKINWSVGNKLVSYEFDCAAVGQQIAGTTRRGTVPYDVELSATTVGKLLGGDVVFTSATPAASTPGASTTALKTETAINPETGESYQKIVAPPNANSAGSPKKTITQGLMGAMNEFQQDLVTRNIYQRADTYKIVWANGAEEIRDATVVLPGSKVNHKSTPQAKPATEDPSALLSEKSKMDVSVRNFTITAGQQILQAIDLAIRNSSYISKQALVVENEDGTTQVKDSARNNPVKWYQISMSAVPTKYDTLRNDYAYEITFTISPYLLQNFDSKYFPTSKFKGIHKSYPYWFTGMNTAVLDFQQTFNSLYNITVTGDSPENSAAAQLRKKYTSSMREIPFYTYQPRSNESSIGAELKGNEVAANAAEYLYSPSDLARAKIRIVGDPAWIQQGSVFAGVNPTSFNYSAFNPDGTINFDSQQVMFEIAWQRPEDYDLESGLADPYARSGGNRQPIQSNVYQATKVNSEFRQGRFEQTIEGSIYMFPIPDGKNKAPGAPTTNSPDESNAETQRLAAKAQQSRGSATQGVTAKVAATKNVNTTRVAPTATVEVPITDALGNPTGLTETVSVAAPAGAVSSNGVLVGLANFFAPKKIGESSAPVPATDPLGNFTGGD